MLSKNQQRYLIWIDLLGFEKIAKELSKKSGVDETKIRIDFIDIINQKLKKLEREGEIIGKNYGERDDWLLVVGSPNSVFKVVSNLLTLNSQYRDQKNIPLEVAIDACYFNQNTKLQGSNLISEPNIIKFLKTNIVTAYREWFANKNLESTKSTFIVLTNNFYEQLDHFDKNCCEQIECNNQKFFSLKPNYVMDRGKLIDFLSSINKINSLSYRRIDQVFVPPDEYETAKNQLDKNKIIFIVGDPEIGKTYFAVRLLWEYYCKGFIPTWHVGSEFEDRKKNREKMTDNNPVDNTISYFEDPFGKIEFEDREELRRMIGIFIQKAMDSNARIIITSRDEVFKEFNETKISQIELEPFKVEMYLINPSYSINKKKLLLQLWAEEFNCKWLKNNKLEPLVTLETVMNLTTPLSFRDFAFSSKNVDSHSELTRLINEKSKETKEAFAEEITQMRKEKVLFLSLVYVYGSSKTINVRDLYSTICKKIGLNSEEYSFDYLINWFKPKIEFDDFSQSFEFVHPSYQEGLVLSWKKRKIETFFINLIQLLIKEKNPEIKGWIGFFSMLNYSEISNVVKELIPKFQANKNVNVRKGVADGTFANFDNLPSEVAFKNLEEIVKDKHREIRSVGISIIGDHFERIPKEVSLQILSNGIEDKAAHVRLTTVSVISKKIKDLPKELVSKGLKCNEELTHFSDWYISYLAGFYYSAFNEKIEKMGLKLS